MDTSAITIRPVTTADTEKIAEIYNHYILNTTATFETAPVSTAEMEQRIATISATNPYIVAEKQHKLLGFAFVHQWKQRQVYHITAETTIYLSPDRLRSGIGTTLLTELIRHCRQKTHYRTLIACITADNNASCKFHEKHGFVRASLFRQVGSKFGTLLDITDYQLIL